MSERTTEETGHLMTSLLVDSRFLAALNTGYNRLDFVTDCITGSH